jgi:PEP-CTERM motif-containing protein
MQKLLRMAFLMSAVFLSLSSLAKADTVALTSVTGGDLATSGDDQLYGWIFTANAPLSVTSLGVFDNGSDGLSISHGVGIFNETTQTLLGSTTVPAGTGGTLIDGYRYESVSPFLLTQGDSYAIVMTMPEQNSDFQIILATSETTAGQITYVTSAFADSSTLVFPPTDGNGDFAQGLFGPNFTFVSATATTPEPSSIMLLGTGVLSIAGFARRRFLRG